MNEITNEEYNKILIKIYKLTKCNDCNIERYIAILEDGNMNKCPGFFRRTMFDDWADWANFCYIIADVISELKYVDDKEIKKFTKRELTITIGLIDWWYRYYLNAKECMRQIRIEGR